MTPQTFAEKWGASQLKESAAYQEHFLDLCDMLGQGTPAGLDSEGKFYTFQKGASKSGGGEGFADVWYKDHFAWEYKGKHKNLDKAYDQLLQYREDLENPPLLVVCDFDRYRVHTNFNNCVKKVYEFTNGCRVSILNTRQQRLNFERARVGQIVPRMAPAPVRPDPSTMATRRL